MLKSLFAVASATLVTGSLSASPALAQTYPNKPIKVIVGAPAGTGPDVELRQIVPHLSAELGQPVVVENKPGNASLLALEVAAKAPADGYTILAATIASLAANPRLYDKSLPVDVEKDLAPISLSIKHPWLLYVRGALAAENFKDFVALAKAKPDTLTFASTGVGSTQHVSLELLQQLTGIKLKHVPYGASPWQNDLVSGQIDASTWPLITLTDHLQSGKIRALAISNGGKRSEQAPNVPQFSEVGVPAFDVTVWAGLVAPTGTPKEIVDRLSAAAAKGAQSEPYRAFAGKLGVTAVGSTPTEFDAFLKIERARWKKVIADSDIKIE